MKVTVINPSKVFNAYEQYVSVGTPSCQPNGRWLNFADLSLCQILIDDGYEVTYIDQDVQSISTVETKELILNSSPDWIIFNSESPEYYSTPLSSYEPIERLISKRFLKIAGNPKTIVYGITPQYMPPPRGIDYYFNVSSLNNISALIKQVNAGEKPQPAQLGQGVLDYQIPAPNISVVDHRDDECSSFFANFDDKPFAYAWWNNFNHINRLAEYGFKNFYLIGPPILDRTFLKPITELEIAWTTDFFPTSNPNWTKKLDLLKESGLTSARVHLLNTVMPSDKYLKLFDDADIDIVFTSAIMSPGVKESNLTRLQNWLSEHEYHAAQMYIHTDYNYDRQNNLNTIDCLEYAGVDDTSWRTMEEARVRWRVFDDQMRNGYLNSLKCYRPDIYKSFREGRQLIEEKL